MKTSFAETNALIEQISLGNIEKCKDIMKDQYLECNNNYFPDFESARSFIDIYLGKWPDNAIF